MKKKIAGNFALEGYNNNNNNNKDLYRAHIKYNGILHHFNVRYM